MSWILQDGSGTTHRIMWYYSPTGGCIYYLSHCDGSYGVNDGIRLLPMENTVVTCKRCKDAMPQV